MTMNRREFLRTSMASGVALTSGANLHVGEKQKSPNILWICTDQQRYDTINALGNPHIRKVLLPATTPSASAKKPASPRVTRRNRTATTQ